MTHSSQQTGKLSKKEIKELFVQAKRILRLSELDILFAPATKPYGQLVIVTSRFIGNAPERNKIKRRLRAIFRQEKFFEKPFHCIVIVKKVGINLSFAELKNALEQAYTKVAKSNNQQI